MQELNATGSGGGNLLWRLRVLGMNTDTKERNGQRAEHAEPDTGKRVPAQVDGTQADGEGPEQRGNLEDVEHDLAFHN